MYILENQVAISTKFTISQLNRYFILLESFATFTLRRGVEIIKILPNRINKNGIRF